MYVFGIFLKEEMGKWPVLYEWTTGKLAASPQYKEV